MKWVAAVVMSKHCWQGAPQAPPEALPPPCVFVVGEPEPASLETMGWRLDTFVYPRAPGRPALPVPALLPRVVADQAFVSDDGGDGLALWQHTGDWQRFPVPKSGGVLPSTVWLLESGDKIAVLWVGGNQVVDEALLWLWWFGQPVPVLLDRSPPADITHVAAIATDQGITFAWSTASRIRLGTDKGLSKVLTTSDADQPTLVPIATGPAYAWIDQGWLRVTRVGDPGSTAIVKTDEGTPLVLGYAGGLFVLGADTRHIPVSCEPG